MKKLIMAILLSIVVPAIAQAKPATCLLEEGGKTLYKGKCDFDPQGNGSFFISHPSFAKKLNFAGVMVWIESKSEVYAQLENRARKNRVGLWADKNPIAPWNFRK